MSGFFSQRVSRRRKRLNQEWATSTTQRRGEGLDGAGLGRDVRGAVVVASRLAAGVVVVAPVQEQVPPRNLGRGLGVGGEGGAQQVLQLLHVRAVGSGDHHADRHAPPVGQQVALGARRAPVGGVAACGQRLARPPLLPSGALVRHPSVACQVSSRPTRSSYRPSGTAQAWAKAPRATHSWKRLWQVDLGLKAALGRLWRHRGEAPTARLVATVHDEIVVEAPEGDAPSVAAWLARHMVAGMGEIVAGAVAIEVETTIARDWAGTPLTEGGSL